MTSPFCLIPQHADKFIERVKSGALSAEALTAMTSAQRRAALTEIMGAENAARVNASFESRLLLKNQKAGIERWIEKAKNLPPAVKRDLLARVERMETILTPESQDAFLADLARQRLGFSVSMEEAGNITSLAQKVTETRKALEAGGDRLDYGRARVEFGNYVSNLKNEIKEPLTLGGAVVKTAGFAKSMKASLDNSALFTQGWKTLFAHPGIWAKNAKQSFVDLVQQFGGKQVLDEVNAEIFSRPNALNGRYEKAKLALANVEEAFPSMLPEKIPGFQRVFKASNAAFNAFQYRSRADVFDKYMEIAQKSGLDLRDPELLQSVGHLVNSLTARGSLGRFEGSMADAANVMLFSPRKLKGDLDVLLLQPLGMGGVGGSMNPAKASFAQKQAAINLVKVITGTAAILTIANAIDDEAVEFDPRSSDFGKVKSGNTRFDVTGGMASLSQLAARFATMESKSTKTGKVSEINSGEFGSMTGTDLAYNFFENKLSPAARIVKDLMDQEDFQGNKPTIGSIAAGLTVPLPIENAQELMNDPNSANVLLALLASALGISTNTFDPKKKKPKP